MNALDVLSAFEATVLDGLPLGEEASELLDRLKAIENLITEVRAFYKEALAKDSSAVPGWWLQPGTIRRSVADPLEAFRRVSNTLSPEQFASCVSIKVAELERLWARETNTSLAKAREPFSQLLAGVIEEKICAPSLAKLSDRK